MAQVDTLLLLKVIRTLDLRKGIPDTIADHIEERLDWVIASEGGIPLDDPLRFDHNGHRISKELFCSKLDRIIESWPIDQGEWKRGRTTNYQGRL